MSSAITYRIAPRLEPRRTTTRLSTHDHEGLTAWPLRLNRLAASETAACQTEIPNRNMASFSLKGTKKIISFRPIDFTFIVTALKYTNKQHKSPCHAPRRCISRQRCRLYYVGQGLQPKTIRVYPTTFMSREKDLFDSCLQHCRFSIVMANFAGRLGGVSDACSMRKEWEKEDWNCCV